jgi:bromodomain-containing factor 1
MQISYLTGRIALLENKKAELEAEIGKLRHPPEQPKAPTKKKLKKSVADDDDLTFEQKKDLSEAIAKLDGSRL